MDYLSNEYFAVSKQYIIKIFGLSMLLFFAIVWTGEQVHTFLKDHSQKNSKNGTTSVPLEVRDVAPTGSATHLEGWARFKPSIPRQKLALEQLSANSTILSLQE